MKFENIQVYNFKHSLRGMRNPKNSWHLSDSKFGLTCEKYTIDIASNVAEAWCNSLDCIDESKRDIEWDSKTNWLLNNGILQNDEGICEYAFIGPKDMKLAKALIAGGSEHRKFLRQIMVTVDITAPLYWWKEFDTYKVGTTANSTSTMHKLTSKPITMECFEIDDFNNIPYFCHINETQEFMTEELFSSIVDHLEKLRLKFLETTDKRYWKELVRLLPESWLQTRTVTMNYENLLSMIHQRECHKLTEWSGTEIATPSFVKFAQSLPYADSFIFVNKQS